MAALAELSDFIDFKNTEDDEPDPGGTCRPHLPPLTTKGSTFKPMHPPVRDPVIQDVPDDPVVLFHRFLPESLVEQWVQYTNESPIPGPEGPPTEQSRKLQWTPTSCSEVYLFFAILICMTIHPEHSISSYWISSFKDAESFHVFTRYMTRQRFEILFRRIRIFPPAEPVTPKKRKRGEPITPPSVYQKLDMWSCHIQEESLKMFKPGSKVSVDECIQKYTGRTVLTTYIPSKPDPEGYKVWIIAQEGFFLSWLWHQLRKGPVVSLSTLPIQPHIKLNPTQTVPFSLIQKLPSDLKYHLFLDNLFPSPPLFKTLRLDLGVAATGTCRITSGIHEDLIKLKKTKAKGKPWGFELEIPTEDELVCSSLVVRYWLIYFR